MRKNILNIKILKSNTVFQALIKMAKMEYLLLGKSSIDYSVSVTGVKFSFTLQDALL